MFIKQKEGISGKQPLNTSYPPNFAIFPGLFQVLLDYSVHIELDSTYFFFLISRNAFTGCLTILQHLNENPSYWCLFQCLKVVQRNKGNIW
jgi:hypothetical protein